MLTVALTGGIGCGKSLVSHQFSTYGVPIIDTDIISRDIMAPGHVAFDQLLETFGLDILSDNQINRSTLKEIVFNNPEKKSLLESILHPQIKNEVKSRLKKLSTPYAIIVVPLLIEAGWHDLAKRILVIDCNPDIQQERVLQRDNMTVSLFNKIAGSQLNRNERIKWADDVIHNNGSLEALNSDVKQLHEQYLSLSKI